MSAWSWQREEAFESYSYTYSLLIIDYHLTSFISAALAIDCFLY